jgi:transcriptional regulator with XRE-family HTH domain
MDIDILERIKKLMQARGWTVYKLSLESGITESTLSNMFKRNSSPNIKTIKDICQAFNITLEEFFNESEEYDDEKEELLISSYRQLNEVEKSAVYNLANSLLENHSRKEK